MSQTYTSDELIDSVRDSASIPNTSATGVDDSRILKYLNQALQARIIPQVLKVREEYYVVTTKTSLVALASSYRIPKRAMVQKLRSLIYENSTGSRSTLSYVTIEESYQFSTTNTSGNPDGYFIEGNFVTLVPNVGSSASGSLLMSFFFRPGDLVLTSSARQITAVNSGTRTVTLSSSNASWSTANTFDIHSKESGAEIKIWDATATTVGATIVFSSSFPIDGSVQGTRAVEVGDWVCLSNEAVVPAIPKEMHPLLIDAAVARVMKAQGDRQSLDSQVALLREETQGMVDILEARNEGDPPKIRGRNGLLRAGRYGGSNRA